MNKKTNIKISMLVTASIATNFLFISNNGNTLKEKTNLPKQRLDIPSLSCTNTAI